MGTYYASLIIDFFISYEIDFMASLIIKKLKLFKHFTLHLDI